MATFVLVHGAMHGGWCWRDVRERLCARGHQVYAPTLTGQGDRRSALTADVGVGTHVTDLTDFLWFSDLGDVHLVLHSYAGVLAGPVAERARGRLASVTYLAAFVAQPGQSLADVEPPDVAARYRDLAASAGDGWVVPASERFLDQWGVTSPALRGKVGPRLTDFPLRCVTDPVDFDPAPLDQLRKIYVFHTRPPLASLRGSYERARAAGWETHEMEFGHDLMLAAPAETADLLEGIAGRLPAAAPGIPAAERGRKRPAHGDQGQPAASGDETEHHDGPAAGSPAHWPAESLAREQMVQMAGVDLGVVAVAVVSRNLKRMLTCAFARSAAWSL